MSRPAEPLAHALAECGAHPVDVDAGDTEGFRGGHAFDPRGALRRRPSPPAGLSAASARDSSSCALASRRRAGIRSNQFASASSCSASRTRTRAAVTSASLLARALLLDELLGRDQAEALVRVERLDGDPARRDEDDDAGEPEPEQQRDEDREGREQRVRCRRP